MSKTNNNTGVNTINSIAGKEQPVLQQDKDINKNEKTGNRKDVKEDFKDEDIPVEPMLDDDGNEIGGEG